MSEGRLIYHVEVVKGLLGITGLEKDSILQLYVDLTIQAVLNYCNISELPSALDYTVCQIASDAYRRNQALSAIGAINGDVLKVEEDGRSVEFGYGKSYMTQSIDKALNGVTQLDRFKKLYRVSQTPKDD